MALHDQDDNEALTQRLIRAGAVAVLLDPNPTIEKMPGGASLRRFYRLRSGDETAIAMDLGPDTQKSEEVT